MKGRLVPPAAVVALLLGGCSGAAEESAPSSVPTATAGTTAADPEDPSYDAALSDPVEDSYYPEHGDPGLDTLHYGLDLTWDPASDTLTGVADVTLRATADADRLQLDLLSALAVSAVTVDGAPAQWDRSADLLVVEHPVAADDRLVLHVEYAGTPAPVPAPTQRVDFTGIGMRVTDGGGLWTMQEPFGAFTWYPVNDHPSDKALYDFTVRTPEDQVGIANGVLESRTVEDGRTVTRWHLSHPAAPYLTTLVVGDYVETTRTSASGVPLSWWTPRGDAGARHALRALPRVLRFNERLLGPYPFDSLGVVVVDSESGMETQTMITLGDTDYTLSAKVLQHETTHQWYGNWVTPTDWRDLWMNEGMAMFLQGVYEAHVEGRTVEAKMDDWARYEPGMRAEAGPPGAYGRQQFGDSNVYYGPALMWNELRKRIGEEAFWAMVREWPRANADGNATRADYLAWLEAETGEELTAFFDAWLLGERTPPRS